MQITKDDDINSLKSSAEDFYSKLGTIKNTYNDQVTVIGNNINKIDFTNVWKDPVQVKVDSYLDILGTSFLNSINSDVSSGGFNQLYTTTKSLIDECQKAIDKKAQIKAAEDLLANTPKRIGTGKYEWDNTDWRGSAYGGTGGGSTKHEVMKDNPDYATNEAALEARKNELTPIIAEINRLLNIIAQCEFQKNVSVDDTPAPIENPPEPEVPEEEEQEEEQEEEEEEEQEEEIPEGPYSYYNRTFNEGNYTVEYSTDERGNPVCKVTEHTNNGDSVTVYSIDEDGYLLLNGSKHQEPNSAYWSDIYGFTFVTVTDEGGKSKTIPVLTCTNVNDGIMFNCDYQYLQEHGVDKEDYHYVYNYAFGGTEEATGGGTLTVNNTAPEE